MDSKEMIENFQKLNNHEREDFLDWIEEKFFDRGITPEQLDEIARIYSLYKDGLLKEVEDEY